MCPAFQPGRGGRLGDAIVGRAGGWAGALHEALSAVVAFSSPKVSPSEVGAPDEDFSIAWMALKSPH
jgi:hypothetical protein